MSTIFVANAVSTCLARSDVEEAPKLPFRVFVPAGQGGYGAKTTFGLRVPGSVETTGDTNSWPVLIAGCIASRNVSSIFSCVARVDISSII